MKITVVGAGVIGVTSAYFLAAAGHEVELIEKNDKAACDTSFANGAQLSYSYSAPLAGGGIWAKMPYMLFSPNSPFRFRPKADLLQYKWLLEFLGNCNKKDFYRSNQNILRLGLHSRDIMQQIIEQEDINFHHNKNGKLHLYDNKKDFQFYSELTEVQNMFGCEEEVLSAEQALKLEPSAEAIRERLIGGVFSPRDESGDAHEFTTALAKICLSKGVKITYQEELKKIISQDGKIDRLITNKREINSNAYLIAAGVGSRFILEQIGIKLPIYPMKGYSITADKKDNTPKTSITDNGQKTVYTCIGNKFRIAGIAEITGYGVDVSKSRLRQILQNAKSSFPDAADYDSAVAWAGLRPMTPDSTAILGQTRYKNLYINAGHGMLGWTMAAASADVISDVITGVAPKIAMEGFEIDRF